jgi:hypothetical protein
MTEEKTEKQQSIQEAMPGIPDVVVSMVKDALHGDVCGRCSAFNPETGMCDERQLLVGPRDPACDYFDEG